MATKFFLPFLIILGISTLSRADVVVPDDRVQNGVTIRAQATTQSQALGLLRPGEQLQFEASVPYWYRVRLADNSIGYVSKSWTNVVSETGSGSFVIHTVDVGTGLAVVVEAPDFVLLYDGGSNDDLARGNNNRLLSYFRAALPNVQAIDHLILSHPHRDHVELLPDLLDAYEVGHVWDTGRLHTICGYRAFLERAAAEPGVTYHNALGNFGTHQASFAEKRCYGQQLPATTIEINEGARISDAPIELGNTGQMRFLYADGTQHSSPNENSLVVRLDLGTTRVLFMGDAEAGGRHPPANPPTPDSIEGTLINCCAAQLRADILIVGHHGSMTSSRTSFLDVVGADTYVVSSGPTRYGSVTLPDQVVIDELQTRGTVWRTDLDDSACATEPSKIGPDNDGEAGGCHNIQLQIAGDGTVSGAYWTTAD